MGLLHSFGLRWVRVSMRIRGKLAIGCIFVPHTSHEGNWCQAGIALPHRNLLPLSYLVSAPALARSFLNSILTTYRCGPCGVVGDALASSKRSGKSTGLLLATLHRRWPDNASSPLDHRAIRRRVGRTKLKRDRGSEGARHWGASSRRKLRGTIKIVIFRRALRLSNPWLEPIVDCGL